MNHMTVYNRHPPADRSQWSCSLHSSSQHNHRSLRPTMFAWTPKLCSDPQFLQRPTIFAIVGGPAILLEVRSQGCCYDCHNLLYDLKSQHAGPLKPKSTIVLVAMFRKAEPRLLSETVLPQHLTTTCAHLRNISCSPLRQEAAQRLLIVSHLTWNLQ